MLPDIIKIQYQDFDNPYRKVFYNRDGYVTCDFSDLIPSYKIDLSDNCPSNLIHDALQYAEQRNYYSFYIVVPKNMISVHKIIMQDISIKYVFYIEEKVLKNEKPINLLFWDWLYETTNKNYDAVIIKWSMSQQYRS